MPTLNKIKEELKESIPFNGSKESVRRILKKIGRAREMGVSPHLSVNPTIGAATSGDATAGESPLGLPPLTAFIFEPD
ncbi:hypothetical protein E2C01_095423 [Portunus trituberculatus]|uniref:Uncharacterized protein n=1 Tax=Portunus trituberculatus TaxID=210409 RepID=A0A5B7K057_PORTR|nr:hypothetical protein [Portunus trituberculatus]